MSLNVRGIGADVKVNWVRKLRSQHKINFLGIQEKQLLDATKINFSGCWGSNEFDCEGVDSHGRSGGIASIWDTKFFQKHRVIKSRRYLIIIGKWTGINVDTIFANIYGPHGIADQRRLWGELVVGYGVQGLNLNGVTSE